MLKIYASSQDFAFGPTSNLFTLIKLIKNRFIDVEINLVRNRSIELFHKNNPGIGDKIVDEIDYQNADLILSSFNPDPIIKAWAYNIKSVYYCNLFWFWHLSHPTELFKAIDILESRTSKSDKLYTFNALTEDNPHLAILLGYYFASMTFARSFPRFAEKIREFNNLLRPVPCKIFKPIHYHTPRKDNFILFQLSGSIIPFLNESHYTIYLKFISKLAINLTRKHPEYVVAVCLNPQLMEIAAPLFEGSAVELMGTVSQEENLKNFERATAVFTSPGLETIFECIDLDAPVFLLPEQSAGQYMNYYLLKGSGYEPECILLDELRSSNQMFKGELDIIDLYNLLNSRLEDHCFIETMQEITESFINNIKDQSYLRSYLSMQHHALEKHMNGEPFSEGTEIIPWIVKLLEESLRERRKEFDKI